MYILKTQENLTFDTHEEHEGEKHFSSNVWTSVSRMWKSLNKNKFNIMSVISMWFFLGFDWKRYNWQ